ncbi:MAG: CAP domain-containing protein [Halobacteriota archaeon]
MPRHEYLKTVTPKPKPTPSPTLTPERKEECKEAFNYLNEIRKNNGRRQLKWDDRAYKLAVARCKDMSERNYFDHVTPEGTCAKDMKLEYGFNSHEILAENCGGMTHYIGGDPIPETNVNECVEGWMSSRGHRYNLLCTDHVSGAIGCYKAICIFYGVHNNPYGLGAGPCTTGEEGLAYWENVGNQIGEI